MCCRCCTTLKVAATWGASIHISLSLLLLIGYFVIDETLGDFLIPYVVYIGLLIPLGIIILVAVQKEIDWLLRGVTWLFILTQVYGFGVRLLVPAQKTSWTILQRIAALFTGILATAVYSAILLLFCRKLRKAKKAARQAREDAEQEAEEERELRDNAAGPSNRSAIEDPPR